MNTSKTARSITLDNTSSCVLKTCADQLVDVIIVIFYISLLPGSVPNLLQKRQLLEMLATVF